MPSIESWARTAAARCGLPEPIIDPSLWLSMHWSEAWAHMEIEEFGRMAKELREKGWTQ